MTRAADGRFDGRGRKRPTTTTAPSISCSATARCSTSYIQRRLSVGYNKAASLVERMEKEGVVGPANHAGKREILIGTA